MNVKETKERQEISFQAAENTENARNNTSTASCERKGQTPHDRELLQIQCNTAPPKSDISNLFTIVQNYQEPRRQVLGQVNP